MNELLREAEQNLTNEERLELWRQRIQDYLDKKCPDEAVEPDYFNYPESDNARTDPR